MANCRASYHNHRGVISDPDVSTMHGKGLIAGVLMSQNINLDARKGENRDRNLCPFAAAKGYASAHQGVDNLTALFYHLTYQAHFVLTSFIEQ